MIQPMSGFNNALLGLARALEQRQRMDLSRREDARQQGEFEQRREANRLALRRGTQADLDRNTLRGMLNRPGYQGDVGGIRDLGGQVVPGTTETGQALPERTQLEQALKTGDIAEAKRVGEFITDRAIGMSKLGDRGGAVKYFQDATGQALGALAGGGPAKDDWIETSRGMFNWRSGEWRQAPAGPMSLDQVRGGMAERGQFDTLQKTYPARVPAGEDLGTFEAKERIRAKYRPASGGGGGGAKPASGAQLASIERNKALQFQRAETDFRKRVAEIEASIDLLPEEKQRALEQAEEEHAERKQQIDEGYIAQRDQFGLESSPVDYRGQLTKKRTPPSVAATAKPVTAVNPQTGERVELRGGQWVPVR